jgi:hypothetical protein
VRFLGLLFARNLTAHPVADVAAPFAVREGRALRDKRARMHVLPWGSFVPDLVTRLSCAPALRPYSAEKFAVSTRNSCTASSVAAVAEPALRWSLLSLRSRM